MRHEDSSDRILVSKIEPSVTAQQGDERAVRSSDYDTSGQELRIGIPAPVSFPGRNGSENSLITVEGIPAVHADQQVWKAPDQVASPIVVVVDRSRIATFFDDSSRSRGKRPSDHGLEPALAEPAPDGSRSNGSQSTDDGEQPQGRKPLAILHLSRPVFREYGEGCEHHEPHITDRPEGEEHAGGEQQRGKGADDFSTTQQKHGRQSYDQHEPVEDRAEEGGS